MLYYTAVLFMSVTSVLGLIYGAPEECRGLLPRLSRHRAQTGPSPYVITSSVGQLSPGDYLTVTISSSPNNYFKEYILQARSPQGVVLGAFTSVPASEKKLTCGTTRQEDTVTHSNKNDKNKLEFNWQAPSNYTGRVVFNGAIVKNSNTFWVGVQSSDVYIEHLERHTSTSDSYETASPVFYDSNTTQYDSNQNSEPPSLGEASTHSSYGEAPTHSSLGEASTHSSYGENSTHSSYSRNSTHPNYGPKPTMAPTPPKQMTVAGCNSTKVCLGFPKGCIANHASCEAIVVVAYNGKVLEFEMEAKDSTYVAVGLSHDSKMGNDSVVECLQVQGEIMLFTSTNEGKENKRTKTSANANRVTLVGSKVTEGKFYCKFTRETKAMFNGKIYDLAKTPYYLLLAFGSIDEVNGITYHGNNVISTLKSHILAVSPPKGKSDAFSCFVAPNSILLAAAGICVARFKSLL